MVRCLSCQVMFMAMKKHFLWNNVAPLCVSTWFWTAVSFTTNKNNKVSLLDSAFVDLLAARKIWTITRLFSKSHKLNLCCDSAVCLHFTLDISNGTNLKQIFHVCCCTAWRQQQVFSFNTPKSEGDKFLLLKADNSAKAHKAPPPKKKHSGIYSTKGNSPQ